MNSGWKRSAAVLAAMVVAVTLLIWAGVHNARSRRLAMQEEADKQASRAVLVPQGNGSGGTAAEAGPDAAPKMQGKVAPAFSLVDLSGKKVALADFKGKPVLVNFWATWCGPCKIEMPWFEEFNKKYAGQGLVILGVSTDDLPKSSIETTANRIGVSYPILLKDDKVEDAYGGIELLPQSFYVGKDGKVLIQTAGLTDDQGGKDQIEANIKKLIAAGGQ